MGYKGTHKGEIIDREITRVLTGEVVTDNTVSTLDAEEERPISSKAIADKFLKLQITAGAEPYTFEMLEHNRAQNEKTFVRLFEIMHQGQFDATFPVYLTFGKLNANWLKGSGSVLSSDVEYNDTQIRYHFLIDVTPARRGCRTIMDIFIYGQRRSLTTSDVTMRAERYNIPTEMLLNENYTIEGYRNEYANELVRISQYKVNFDKKDRLFVRDTTLVNTYELAFVRYASVCSNVANITHTLDELLDYIDDAVTPRKNEYEAAVAALEAHISRVKELNDRKLKWNNILAEAQSTYSGYLGKYGSRDIIKSLKGGVDYLDKLWTFEDDCDYYINGGNDDETVVSNSHIQYCLAKASFDANGGKFILDLNDTANMENWPMAIKEAYKLSQDLSVEWDGASGGKERLAKVEEDLVILKDLLDVNEEGANKGSSTRVQLQQELVALDVEYDRFRTLVNNLPLDLSLSTYFRIYEHAWVGFSENYRSVLASEAAKTIPKIYQFTETFGDLRQTFYGYREDLMQYIIDNGIQ